MSELIVFDGSLEGLSDWRTMLVQGHQVTISQKFRGLNSLITNINQ